MTVNRVVQLYGGPLHGLIYSIPENATWFVVHGVSPSLEGNPASPEDILDVTESTYSQVSGRPGAFEWDGWKR